jgi:hypothetical protein
LRARFPHISIILRADAGFGFGETIHFCEKHQIDYVIRSNDFQVLT